MLKPVYQRVRKKKNKPSGERQDLDKGGLDSRKSKRFFLPTTELKNKTKLKDMRKVVFRDRYSFKDDGGKPLEKYPEQMWHRVSRGIAQFESSRKLSNLWSDKFYELMKDFKFVPAGRILSGAGTGYEVTFFNCYVIPSPLDSRGGIMESITTTVEIQARAGGVGVNLSSLRPSGARVKKVNGTSSGPVNWACLYSSANHDVIQQGGSRRGALMLMLDDWHPDVDAFIKTKEDLSKIPGANLSVSVSDKFMEQVKKDGDWDLVFPDLDDPEYDDVWDGDIDKWRALGKKIKIYKTLKAREIWEMIAKAAWKSAEPGVVFMERYNKTSNTYYFEKIICVNPCGEQGLGAWSVCNLGSMNLSAYVSDGDFDYKSLARDVKTAMRFMDNVVEANFYFYKENEKAQKNIRRTGLGTMGLGDTLIKMKIRYGSDESLEMIEKIYKTIRDSAYEASVYLAKEKGVFPMFDKDKYLQSEFVKTLSLDLRKKISKYGVRNAVILTQAPTGTTSLLAGVSSGIEPNYDFEFKRVDRTGEHIIYHRLYKRWVDSHSKDEKVPDYFVGAKQLSPEDHVRVQALVQKYTDSSISKTVNAPESYSVEDVKKLYSLAYDLGCKGITFFRDGSREGVLSSVDSDKKSSEKEIKQGSAELKPRPKQLSGETYEVRTPLGSAFVTINVDAEGNPFEVFLNVGKAGSHVKADAEALGRLISLSFRVPSELSSRFVAEAIIDQLSGIGGSDSVGFGNGRIRSLADGVAKVLKEHLNLSKKANLLTKNEEVELASDESQMSSPYQSSLPLVSKTQDLCPECGQASWVMEEGCSKCYSCGASKC